MADARGKYVRSAGFVARRVAGEMVLVPVHRGSDDPRDRSALLYVLNESGEHLWQALSTGQEADELARKLTMTFDVSLDTARADVEAFLSDLLGIGAVQRLETV
jgi:hypothetical protein